MCMRMKPQGGPCHRLEAKKSEIELSATVNQMLRPAAAHVATDSGSKLDGDKKYGALAR